MSQNQNNLSEKKTAQAALGLSLMPSIFAAGCCAITPIAFMFGFASSEFLFPGFAIIMRCVGVLLLVVSVCIFFYKKGIRSAQDIQDNKKVIGIICVQTVVLSGALYYFLVAIAVPIIWTRVLEQTGSCCGI